jgi:transposase
MMLTREAILTVYAAGPDAVVALVEQLLAHIAHQDQQIVALTARVNALEARLGKDSHNSHKPPASDGLARKTRSQRKATGRPSGGQPGHPGTTLQPVAQPDQIVVHTPLTCGGCGALLTLVPESSRACRQVHDLPPLRLLVTEHQAVGKVCPHCQAQTRGAFPPTATQPVQYGPRLKAVAVYLQQYQLLPFARTQELLATLFGCSLSEGTLATAAAVCAARLEPIEAAIKAALTRATVAHFDETGVRIGSHLQWLHQAGTAGLTYYTVHPKRGKTATEAIGILPAFTGTSVHDGWPAYAGYPCRHALCNAHHLRELTFVAEQTQQPWATALIALLLEGKAAVAAAQAAGAGQLASACLEDLTARYAAWVTAGLAANPPPPSTGKRGRRKQSGAKNLLDRLDRHRDSVLAFLNDFAVPFDNNLAERDLRMVKVRQKVSGCFRTPTGAAAFCRIRGYISTLRKQGIDVVSALRSTFAGHPISPSYVAG